MDSCATESRIQKHCLIKLSYRNTSPRLVMLITDQGLHKRQDEVIASKSRTCGLRGSRRDTGDEPMSKPAIDRRFGDCRKRSGDRARGLVRSCRRGCSGSFIAAKIQAASDNHVRLASLDGPPSCGRHRLWCIRDLTHRRRQPARRRGQAGPGSRRPCLGRVAHRRSACDGNRSHASTGARAPRHANGRMDRARTCRLCQPI